MTKKADFNAEEWSQVVEGPPLAAIAVITAQHGGTVRESISMAKAYAEAQKEHSGPELMDELLTASPAVNRKELGPPAALRENVDEHLRTAIGVLEQKATKEEVDAYKAFAMKLAERVAEAHKSGGFLGIGGERVSGNEREAIEHLAATLGVDPPPAPAT